MLKKSVLLHVIAPLVFIAMLLSAGILFSENPLVIGNEPAKAAGPNSFGNIPVFFEENRGQYADEVRFAARSSEFELFLTEHESVYVLPEPAKAQKRGKEVGPKLTIENPPQVSASSSTERAVALRMKLAGANPNPVFKGLEELPGKTSHFKGSDRSKWQTNIPTFSRVVAENVYHGIDAVWHGKTGGEIRYDFIIKPNADPGMIAWEIAGAKDVSLNDDGDLLITTEFGAIKQSKPHSFQDIRGIRKTVQSRFFMRKQDDKDSFLVSFEVGEYDRNEILTIDPIVSLRTLGYSTFLGGSNTDQGNSVAVDGSGNVFVTGTTMSTDFPTTAGVTDTTQNGGFDIFVTKLNPSGSSILYSTYIGGGSTDTGYAIAVDSAGNAYVAGGTLSSNFPTTAGAFDTSFNQGSDVFALKLDSTASQLLYSTYIGGDQEDVAYDVTIDSSGNLFLTGTSIVFSANPIHYPTTIGAFDTTHGGNNAGDVIVTKLNPTGSALVYSTFLGGPLYDIGYGIALSPTNGVAYVTGFTSNLSYPTTPIAFDTSFNGVSDAFISKLNFDGSGLHFSTFVGGSNTEQGTGIAVDQFDDVYITGTTDSTNFPTNAGAFDTTHNGLNDVFVTKLTSIGISLMYSTFIGGTGDDEGNDIALDSLGNAYVTGRTNDQSYPTTPRAFDTTLGGFADAFVSGINANGSAMLASTFVGGDSDDKGNGIAIDSMDNGYITGETQEHAANNYPTTSSAYDRTYNGGMFDAFVTKFNRFKSTTADFDCDGKTDISIFRPSDRTWWISQTTAGTLVRQWGSSTDKLVPADYDGDCTIDFGIFRPSDLPTEPDFYVLFNRPGFNYRVAWWGSVGDIPLNGDFDGDGQTDYSVFRPSNGTWYIFRSSNSSVLQVPFGIQGDIPLVMDYNGDGLDDFAVFRPADQTWYIARPSGIPAQNFNAVRFGLATDKLVPADYDGDGRTDIAVFRPSDQNWYILESSTGDLVSQQFGLGNDVPVPGDYDGDGSTDIAIFRDGDWWILESSSGIRFARWGQLNDIPIPK